MFLQHFCTTGNKLNWQAEPLGAGSSPLCVHNASISMFTGRLSELGTLVELGNSILEEACEFLIRSLAYQIG